MTELAELPSDHGLKNCFVSLNSLHTLRTCFVKLAKVKPTDAKLSREGKNLLKPKKSNAKNNKDLHSVKKGRVSKKDAKNKFQLKITNFFQNPKLNNTKKTGNAGRKSPDSGVGSRSESPENESELNSDSETTENDNDSKEDHEDSSDEESGVESDESDWEDGKEDYKPVYKTKKLSKPAAKRASAATAIKVEYGEKGEYEKERDKKIKEKEDMMAALKAQWTNFKAATAISKPKTLKRPRMSVEVGELRRSNRSQGEKPEYGELNDEDYRPPSQKVKRESYFDEGSYRYAQKEPGARGGQGKTILDPNVDILQPEDVTESMIKKIHIGGRKTYCSSTGTCCHQCRQKTTDTKTVCRSGYCIGVRGQFCGTCLNNRYGESVAEALKDPEWECPPCRNICNCSFCLETPTGQLYYLAREKGFKSVHHYLQHLREKWDQED
eukprot:TRINITY_DN2482_c0_g1_i7.p1 TRINITY_DN2482_c0_g1~~TRINITY_DN2482_c0_g1_i7.p1  ORF type:complete len:439 (+),score=105.61 TRINITY_DN2482_c0_g1_i7:42-1358(+)